MSDYARITTEDGDFNEVCDVQEAGAMVAFGLITYDGEGERGEHCYTVTEANAGAVVQFIAEGRWAANRDPASLAREVGTPGYPGEPPAGVSWESWLAMNNVD